MSDANTKKWINAALFAALTTVCTMMIRIPTPTGGYIHPGDGLVLLCGVFLGPSMGALSAGIGSALSDLFSGYLAWAPATFVIKAISAFLSGLLFSGSSRLGCSRLSQALRLIIGGCVAEAWMVFGYFLFEIGLNAVTTGSLSFAAIASSVVYSAAGIPANIMQAFAGIIIASLLLPILQRIKLTIK